MQTTTYTPEDDARWINNGGYAYTESRGGWTGRVPTKPIPTDRTGRVLVAGSHRICANGSIACQVRAADGVKSWTFMSAAMRQYVGL